MTAIWITIGIGILGFLPLLIVLWKRKRVREMKEQGVLTTGIVDRIEERMGFKGSRYYLVYIRYTAQGQPIISTYTFMAYKILPIFAVGAEVAIYYNPKKPGKFLPRDVPQSNAMLIFGIVIAVAYIVISFFLYDFLKENGM